MDKRYIIRYNPTGRYWEIYDRQLHAIVEGGYSWEGVRRAEVFYNDLTR